MKKLSYYNKNNNLANNNSSINSHNNINSTNNQPGSKKVL